MWCLQIECSVQKDWWNLLRKRVNMERKRETSPSWELDVVKQRKGNWSKSQEKFQTYLQHLGPPSVFSTSSPASRRQNRKWQVRWGALHKDLQLSKNKSKCIINKEQLSSTPDVLYLMLILGTWNESSSGSLCLQNILQEEKGFCVSCHMLLPTWLFTTIELIASPEAWLL